MERKIFIHASIESKKKSPKYNSTNNICFVISIRLLLLGRAGRVLQHGIEFFFSWHLEISLCLEMKVEETSNYERMFQGRSQAC